MIGLPLRLLAREVYNKVVDRVGAENVALITGEEKIKPPNPRYWVATVEAMPRDLDLAFVAIDEVPARLRSRARPCLHRPHAQPPRARGDAGARRRHRPADGREAAARRQYRPAAAAFDAHSYRRQEDHPAAAAQRDRRVLGRRGLCHRRTDPPPARRRGGGARRAVAPHPQRPGRALPVRRRRLSRSPPTPSAWGSISMSITSHLHPTANSTATSSASLNPAELAQIAGRAGRAQRDGTFGTTGRCPPFDERSRARARKPLVRADQGAAMAQHRAGIFIDRRAAGLAGDDADRAGPHPRADRRRHPGAGTCCAR